MKDIQNEQSEAPFDEDDDLEEDDMDEEFDQYDELGRTPPRTRMFNNRKWKDNKKHMSDLGWEEHLHLVLQYIRLRFVLPNVAMRYAYVILNVLGDQEPKVRTFPCFEDP